MLRHIQSPAPLQEILSSAKQKTLQHAEVVLTVQAHNEQGFEAQLSKLLRQCLPALSTQRKALSSEVRGHAFGSGGVEAALEVSLGAETSTPKDSSEDFWVTVGGTT